MNPKKPRSYGRQADGKTIKSLSLDAEVAAWAEEQAALQKVSFSKFMESALADRMQLHESAQSAPPPPVINKHIHYDGKKKPKNKP